MFFYLFVAMTIAVGAGFAVVRRKRQTQTGAAN